MNIKDLAEQTSGPVRAALLALEAKVMMLYQPLTDPAKATACPYNSLFSVVV